MAGNIPPFLVKIQRFDPQLISLVEKEYGLVFDENAALGPKETSLIFLALDAFAGSSGVKPLAELCRRFGAVDAEIAHALRIAHLVAGNKILSSASSAFND